MYLFEQPAADGKLTAEASSVSTVEHQTSSGDLPG